MCRVHQDRNVVTCRMDLALDPNRGCPRGGSQLVFVARCRCVERGERKEDLDFGSL